MQSPLIIAFNVQANHSADIVVSTATASSQSQQAPFLESRFQIEDKV